MRNGRESPQAPFTGRRATRASLPSQSGAMASVTPDRKDSSMSLTIPASDAPTQARATGYTPAVAVAHFRARAEQHMQTADGCAELGRETLADFFWQRGARTAALATALAEQHGLVHV
jgi:hypothetical protein